MAAGVLGKAIILIKGDSAIFDVTPMHTDGTPYEPQEGDSLVFVLKKHDEDEMPLLEIPIPIDVMAVEFLPSDTINLPAGKIDGRYRYYVELTRNDGWVDTFINNANFLLLNKA